MKSEFDRVYEIMEESFPYDEMRTYEGQKALLKNDNYKLICKKDENENIIAFMTLWKTDSFYFIEHLATSKESRGSGIGSKFLKQYIENAKKPIILEVEPPTTEIAKRRIGFYERLGFHLSDFCYEQPPLREDSNTCPLQIMSYPKPLSEKDFLKYKNVLFKHIYKVDIK